MSNYITINVSALSHMGLVRVGNEDNLYINGTSMNEEERVHPFKFNCIYDKRQHVIAVCDGMGGESNGEAASMAVVQSLKDLDVALYNDYHMEFDNKISAIQSFIQKVNMELCNFMKNNRTLRMGTTLAGLLITGEGVIPFNLGDSRIYLLRDHTLMQLTVDHTESQRLIRLGIIDKEQSKTHNSKHQLTRHIGILDDEGSIEAEIGKTIMLNEHDIFLFCSDGLTEHLEDQELEDILNMDATVEEKNLILLNEALARGGRDNITSIVAGIENIGVDEFIQSRRTRVHRKDKTFMGKFVKMFKL